MLGLGLASSHAPAMFEPKERWPLVYSRIPEYTKESQPHTAKLETPEVIQGYIDRITTAFDVLRQQLEAYQPEALIVVGDDQGDMFDASNNPTFAIYTGEELWGLDGTSYRPLEERHKVTFPCHAELARSLHKGLIKKGFDLASCAVFKPVGLYERVLSAFTHCRTVLQPGEGLSAGPRCVSRACRHLRLWWLIARSFWPTCRLD